MKYAAVIGTFDGLHRGHAALLNSLRHIAADNGLLSMAVTFDRHPLSLINPEAAPQLLDDNDERIARLEREVDRVLVLEFTPQLRQMPAADFLRLLADNGVAILIMGYDTRFGADMPADLQEYHKAAQRAGIRIVNIDDAVCHSDSAATIASSAIRAAVAGGDLALANDMLGHPYQVSGTVVSGRHQGRLLGFPTANIRPAAGRLVPAPGVYAALAHTDSGTALPAMVNIGTCPTFNCGNATQTIEAHLIGFNADIYGKRLSLDFIQRIRAERRFDSPEALAELLKMDRETVLQTLNNYYK